MRAIRELRCSLVKQSTAAPTLTSQKGQYITVRGVTAKNGVWRLIQEAVCSGGSAPETTLSLLPGSAPLHPAAMRGIRKTELVWKRVLQQNPLLQLPDSAGKLTFPLNQKPGAGHQKRSCVVNGITVHCCHDRSLCPAPGIATADRGEQLSVSAAEPGRPGAQDFDATDSGRAYRRIHCRCAARMACPPALR